MKKLLLVLLCLPMIGFGQYSDYYIKKDVNVSGTIDHNVNISGEVIVTQNIKTIDYGQLALAEAEAEKNRLEKLKYADQKDRLISLEIASNPIKAYDFGETKIWSAHSRSRLLDAAIENRGLLTVLGPNQNGKATDWGFKKLSFKWKKPHSSLMNDLGNWKYQNISEKNITTTLEFMAPFHLEGLKKKERKKYKGSWMHKIISKGAEEYAKKRNLKEGELMNLGFLHKKDINKAQVCGNSGYLSTIIYEDDYEYGIHDTYYAVNDGIVFRVVVKYTGDKDNVNFESLEGRRYYLKRLFSQIISTARLYDYKKN